MEMFALKYDTFTEAQLGSIKINLGIRYNEFKNLL